jgi:hypothetical protein
LHRSRLLTRIGIGLLVGAALLLLTGVLLPREHRARSCITLDQPAESLYTVMRDIGGTPRWWPEMETAVPADSGGVERWTETAGGFTMTVRVEEDTPGVGFVTVIEPPPDAVFGGRWSHRVGERTAAGHTVCLTEEGWVSNPLFRVMSALGGHHATIDSYLRALAQRFGTTYVPAHLD